MRDCANHHYYFRVGLGHWQGEFGCRVLDWHKFWLDSIGLVNRVFVVLMHIVIRLLGNASITSILRPVGENKVSNEVRITKFGVVLYTLTEEYILNPDCTHVWVRSRERFGPIPFLFNRKKEHPAEIHDGGKRAVYFIPLLGTNWIGEYTVSPNAQYIHSILRTSW